MIETLGPIFWMLIGIIGALQVGMIIYLIILFRYTKPCNPRVDEE